VAQVGSTVDGSEILCENQLRLVDYPMIYKDLYIPGGCYLFGISEPSTVFKADISKYFPSSGIPVENKLPFCTAGLSTGWL